MVAQSDNLYNNVTRRVFNTVEGILPANRAEVNQVKADFEAYKAVSKAEFTEYKAESEAYKSNTTAIINALVGEVNSLTPVSHLFGTPACND